MNAQTVVDTFAPFVGTEGLRGIVSIRANKVDPLAVVIIDDRYGDRSIPYNIAHGFLLSRLAAGLALLDYTFYPSVEGGGRVVASSPDGEALGNGTIDSFDDYPSAILAAARVEWPKREPAEPDEIPVTIGLGGTDYHMIVRDPELVAMIRKRGIDGIMSQMIRAVSD